VESAGADSIASSLREHREVEFGAFVVPDASADVLGQVMAVERAGLDLVGIQDHPYQRRFYDTFSLIAWLAGRTERVRLFPAVANLPLRQPAMVAKEAASIDVLSGGRFELGLGAGAFWDAIEAFGGPRRSGPESVDALEEAIAILRACWAGQRSVTFEGSHYRVRGMKFGPPPAHPIGIWLGAYGPRMMRVVGRLADGWFPSLPRLPLDEIAGRVRLIDEAAERAGRDPRSIRRIANLGDDLTQGPASQVIDVLGALRDEHGFDAFLVGSDQVERFAAEVVPALRA
jgi:alkanesulfonate monooxygenase SsuD/methylene tetrahydromethanopterin reductase-like flavin-dependent oxidoreductase (luciferase family)